MYLCRIYTINSRMWLIYQKLIYFAQRQERNTELTEVETDGVAKFPLLYLPGIVGITIARLANLKTIYLILFGEFCNLLAYIILVYLSIKIFHGGGELFLWLV